MSAVVRRRWTAVGLLMVVLVTGLVLIGHQGPILADRAFTDWIVGHRGDTSVVAGLSEIFGPVLVSVWTLVAAAALLVRDRSMERAVSLVAVVLSAGAITEVIKLVVGRPRPPMRYHAGVAEMTYSYPSGHVTGTSALVLGIAIIATLGARPVVRRWVVAVGIVIVAVAAGTRLYLGVHWLSDVLAGFAVGAASALVIPDLVAAARQRVTNRTTGIGRVSGRQNAAQTVTAR